ncbi:bifunctional serine/threonine-protein kinase/glutamate ABC transporter substrate-binding protein [Streptomyces sp. DSM 44915]|uniref:Bifunctional serine/threonine-protein kinase/glutamate ABC transporter substrate-binding protein n=1 Tax=Streptomyces chisholmiae TaxID=3075540 RepID=A0ABU2JJ93_9ACTN|nr:bifunctional serine/threonine-protein kinase/glutamate ABC transporter substrate-binding protein [Streptomyces sp. DSM 44915]MDT0264793.1 bifunctional serine/threonine-protein kinase/glutamate ABC transporter substrate-binding protein [Streptomyces sp. DSM 44915]
MEPLRRQDPKRLGEFTLLARLGSGGMGVVFLGRSPGGMSVAVKVIRADVAEEADALARFRREAATVRAVRSPYSARLVATSLDAPPYWLATEFAPGPTLLHASRGRPLEPDLCTGLFAALAEALAAVHGHGVVHRDVKPHNVILSPGGPQLIDYGIAKAAEHTQLTHTGQTPGTVGYTAPEVLLGGAAGPAADVFALGATMAAAATGRPPYGGGEWPAVSYRVVHGEVDVAGVEPRLAELIRHCVAREPADRPDPLTIVRRLAVDRTLAEDPAYQRLVGSAAVPPPPPHPPGGGRRRAGLWATATLATAGLGVVTAVWLWPENGDGARAEDPTSESAEGQADSGADVEPGPEGTVEGVVEGPEGDDPEDEPVGGAPEGLTIGVRYDQPGFGVFGEDGELAGFDIEVARYVAAELGVAEQDVALVEVSSAEREDLLLSGQVDLVVATFQITESREAEIDFAGPYLAAYQDLLVRAGETVPYIEALNDLSVCAPTGSSAGQALLPLAPGVTLVERSTLTECLDALGSGEVDALTNDDALLAGYAAQERYAGDFELAGLRLGGELPYGVGLPEGETALRADVDAALRRMVEDGSWAAAVEAHLGGASGYAPEPPVF